MTEKKVGELYSGFRLKDKRNIEDIASIGYIFEHEKSGARLLYISNDDSNKVFSISFKTPYASNKGVQHIMEHSVLCGSRKYKAKEPFVELLKGSLNTYLNAMTFNDKTMYPVASMNDKDFKNLMDVYLDAVFYPLIYDRPEIFWQEGWHYTLDEQEKLGYNGVVYNEMKGAYSSPDSLFYNEIRKSLYPDNEYSKNSGGDPKEIPELSYEDFLNFHREYYHPSNSYIYIYGNGDMDEYLNHINEEYLASYDRLKVDSEVKEQKPFSEPIRVVGSYPISVKEEEKDKTYLSLNFGIKEHMDVQTILSMQIVNYVLMYNSASPLRKALLDAEIGKEVYSSFSESYDSMFSIVAKNANSEDEEKFKNVVFNTLKELVKNGIDKKLLEGAINVYEFQNREAEFGYRPKGLVYGIVATGWWIYGADPIDYIEFSASIENAKSKLTSDYFERLIEKYLLNNSYYSTVVFKPEKGLESENEAELEQRLEQIKDSMTKEQIDIIKATEKRLEAYHKTEDSKEILEQIPVLEIKDIEKEIEKIELKEHQKDGYKNIYYFVNTNKIAYLTLRFDSTVIPQDNLKYLTLLSSLLGDMSTKGYTYEELNKELAVNIGGISFSHEKYWRNEKNYYPMFVVSAKCLVDKIPKLMELLSEMLTKTLFTDDKHLKELIKEFKVGKYRELMQRGDSTMLVKSGSNIFQGDAFSDETNGIGYYEFLSELEENLNTNLEHIKTELVNVYEKIFNKKNVLINITIAEDDKDYFEKYFELLMGQLKAEELPKYKYEFKNECNKEAFLTAGKVNYVAKSADYMSRGYSYSGSMRVLENVVAMDYLWNKVRVQGGAYGSNISVYPNGKIGFSSYRDPNIVKTLDAYSKVDEYLLNFKADDREMRKYIIGTISGIDRYKAKNDKAKTATALKYILNVTDEMLQKERDEILGTTVEQIKNYSQLFKDTSERENIAVMGNEKDIESNKVLFDGLNSVFQR